MHKVPWYQGRCCAGFKYVFAYHNLTGKQVKSVKASTTFGFNEIAPLNLSILISWRQKKFFKKKVYSLNVTNLF